MVGRALVKILKQNYNLLTPNSKKLNLNNIILNNYNDKIYDKIKL